METRLGWLIFIHSVKCQALALLWDGEDESFGFMNSYNFHLYNNVHIFSSVYSVFAINMEIKILIYVNANNISQNETTSFIKPGPTTWIQVLSQWKIIYEVGVWINDVHLLLMIWWRHQMETFSALLALCAGNSPVTGEFPEQRPVTRSFDVFFDPRRNKRMNKPSRRRWFETPSC